MFFVLGLVIKAQTWAPLDTGYFDTNFHNQGLCADTANGNIIQTNGGVKNVFHNGKWEFWYPNILQNNSIEPIVRYKNKKNLFLKFFYENNDPLKLRTAFVRFSTATDMDTLLIIAGDWTNAGYTYFNNDLILTMGSSGGHTVNYNSVAKFDGTSLTAMGKPTWGVTDGGVNNLTVYNNELYAVGSIDSSIAVLKPGGWKIVYPGIHGGNKAVGRFVVYNNRLYVLGAFWKSENANNPGNGIAAWDGTKWDDLGGGASNEFVQLNGYFDDAVVCNNKLYLVGNFTNVSGIQARGLVSWNDTTWCTICKDINNCNGRLYTIECLRDTVYCYGNFAWQSGNDIGWMGKLINMNLTDTCSAPMFAGIKDYSNSGGIKLYPNPVANTLFISAENEFENSEIEIMNCLGQTVMKSEFKNQLDVSQFSSGCYLLKVTSKNNASYYSKFIKE